MGLREGLVTTGSIAIGWFFIANGEKIDVKGGLAQDRAVHPEVAKTSKQISSKYLAPIECFLYARCSAMHSTGIS